MANSELRAAARTFYREKSYAVINLSGLSLAIACCLILGLYLRSELTYDRHHARHKEIFRIVNEFTTNGSPANFAYTSPALGPLLKQTYPEIVKDYVRIRPVSDAKVLIQIDDRIFYWDRIYYADENLFDIFTHDFIYGDPKTALKEPSSAVVSETFARKYFGDANPIGKTIQADIAPAMPRKITAVFRDLPDNTHLKYDAIFRDPNLPPGAAPQRAQLFGVGYFTYLVMPENYNIKNFETVNDSFYKQFMEETGKSVNITWRSWLQPLAGIHLHSDVAYDLPTGNKYYIYGFAAVAAFILVIACINYINLAMARSTKRAKEIGMRKILGISRPLLMFRFLGESVLFSMIALIFGIAIVEAALKLIPINELLGKSLKLDLTAEPILLAWLLLLGLVVGLISGLYPAAYLSSISPLSALSSSQGGKRGGYRIREMLVLLQFTVSVIVIACTIIMALQMRFISRKPLGFDKQNRVIVNLTGLEIVLKYDQIKEELKKNSKILGVTASSQMISVGQNLPMNAGMIDNNNGVPEMTITSNFQVDNNFIQTMGMELVSGRDFSSLLLTDVGRSFVVNETMVKNKGWENPLGKRIQLGQASGKVIGVVKDFHFKSLHNPIEPLAMFTFEKGFDFSTITPEQAAALRFVLLVHIAEDDVQQTLNFLQQVFTQFDPRHPFEYRFLDDAVDSLYMSENRLMRMTGIFSGICIFISCLGLFGLASYTTEQRSKEIGIRKVLGASAAQIIVMLSRKILLLVLAGSIVATVVAYYAISEWLTGFNYRADIHPLVFVISAGVVIAVAFATVALQSFRTAQANPSKMLRYE
jgi:putative ABC transport system permease protein